MKNKLVVNIIIAYFVLLCVVLVSQLSDESEDVPDSVIVETKKPDKLENTIVIYIDSPYVIVNKKQFIIDESDKSVIPIIRDGITYIPLRLLSTALKADVSWDGGKREATVRYNNRAAVFREDEKKVRVVDNIDDNDFKIDGSLLIINEKSYVPLKVVTSIFEKNLFFDRRLIVISEKNNVFNSEKEKEIVDELIEKFNKQEEKI